MCIQSLKTQAPLEAEKSVTEIFVGEKDQSRTNGPINANLTIVQVCITTTMKNKKHCCKSCVKVSAAAQQYKNTTKLVANTINMYVTFNLLMVLEKQTFFEN